MEITNNTAATSQVVTSNSREIWHKFDIMWMLNLFGTAVGAGILFLPITAGMSGLWPLVIITLIVGPMTYFAHRGLARLVLASSLKDGDITNVTEEFFGKSAGLIITALYFFAIYPILLIYGVSITNTVDSFIVNQLHMSAPPRVILAGICVFSYIAIIICGEKLVLLFNEKLVYPLCCILFAMSLYLIPKWDLSQFSFVPDFGSFASTLWITIPVLVFAFNHSPAISTFAVSQKERYGDQAEKYASRTLKYTSGILVLFVMLFVFSCVLSLSPQDLSMARAQNISILSYLANKFDAPVIAYFGPFVAFLAISTSFFGHYMGAREGLNGIIVKLTPGAKMVSKRRNRVITLFFLLTLWFVATVNPSILSLIESLGGPIIAIILFLMPMYAIAKIPAMKKYQGSFSNVFITVMGIVTIASLLLSFI